ncbi:MAG: cell division ATP-binding protein FtsE [Calditrichia bacterium]|jgi:cell division transport system ATP-binding protein|nr:cell division ATP-binding protein FtsE [Calditrichia bacterium]
MIQFFNVDLQYGDRWILHHITFHINKGEFVYIIGPTGVGKSSILKLIYFDEFPDSGTVIINQYSSAKIKLREIPFIRRKLGIVFQDFKLLPDRNVFENVAFALRVTGAPSSIIKKKVLRVLNEAGLGNRRNHYPRELSGGEQQRVAIARALVNEPFILLADEPTGNLDPKSAIEILEILESINKRGTAVLMATHNYSLIKQFPHQTLSMLNGELREE